MNLDAIDSNHVTWSIGDLMKLILALLVLAGCGYGAYTHLQDQEKQIAAAERAKLVAASKRDESLQAVEEMNTKVKKTIEELEVAKTRAFEQIKAELAADFANQKSSLEQELNDLKSANTEKALSIEVAIDALKKQTAQTEIEIADLTKTVAKADQLNTVLYGYVKAEEKKTKVAAPFNYTDQQRVRMNISNY